MPPHTKCAGRNHVIRNQSVIELALPSMLSLSAIQSPFLDLLLGVFTQLQSQFNDCQNTIPSGSNAAIRFEQDQNCMVDIVHTLL
jgi:hypothetical protein